MHYHICHIQPQNYPHSAAFTELIELIRFGLEDLGHTTSAGQNNVLRAGKNILVGCHLVPPSLSDQIPPSTIILNTEQLHDGTEKFRPEWNRRILYFAQRFETWDYSARNIAVLNARSARPAKLLPIGYHPKLRRIIAADTQDIDLLFYGTLSPRRKRFLAALTAAGIGVKSVFGVYGQERDALIARAKVVLNLHHSPAQIFEIVRVFYLMTNGKAVVSEVNSDTSIDPRYVDGILPAGAPAVVEACKRLIEDDTLRRRLEERALQTIQNMPQAELMAPLLES